MLMRAPASGPVPRPASRRERQLWHDAARNAPALGCHGCPERPVCGGICAAAPYFDCLTYCCGKPASCSSVCRAAPEAFARRMWEVEGFDLSNVPRGEVMDAPALPQVVPVFFHGSRREGRAAPEAAALPLCAMFGRRDGAPRFRDPEALRKAFRLAPDTPLVLTGTDEDPPLERWWEIGATRRAAVIRAMRVAGVGMVTTPNYSLTTNVPRWDDLYAIKRIGLVHAEFLAGGMPAALHVNGRTDADFRRWTEFIAARPEVTHVAYEFTTIWGTRRDQHAAWLTGLAAGVGRPLHLVVRGGFDLLGRLVPAFAGLTVLETESFMRTMKRRRAVPEGNARLGWRAAPTKPGAPLDALHAANTEEVRAWLRSLMHDGPGEDRA